MSKIENSAPKIIYYQQQPVNVEKNHEREDYEYQNHYYEPSTSSLSEARETREGFDYSALLRYELEDNYKGNNGQGWGKGGKKEAMEEIANLEAQLYQIIETQAVEAKVQAQETLKEDIKREEINTQEIRQDERSSDVKNETLKTDRKVDNYVKEARQSDVKHIT